jgi:3-hydroxyisobutyrate dehydrogenase-like beta-hydroxyacid dehydrogenase
MGTPDAAIVVAGAQTAFQRCQPLLRALAGGLTYVGEQIGAASVLDCALLSFVFGASLGALHGHASAKSRVCVEDFGSMLAGLGMSAGLGNEDLAALIKVLRGR